jgi:hypothetical protein
MENSEQFQYNDGRVIVPYDKNRKKVTFYDTYVDINGDVVRYDDIAVFQSEALDSSSQIVIYLSSSFSYRFVFTTYDRTVHVFKRLGYSAYGLGTYKRVKKEFDPIADAMYNIVLHKVFDRVLERIENGATVKICGLTITKDKITLEKRKQTVVIDKSNFAAANVSNFSLNHSAQIFLKDEKRPVFKVSLNEPNARLIVPLANHLMRQQA